MEQLYTFGNVIRLNPKEQLVNEYIVEYMVGEHLYRDNYFGKTKEGINIKIYYDKNDHSKFTLY